MAAALLFFPAGCQHRDFQWSYTWEGGSEGMAILLNRPNPPTAVLCCNDVAAVGALKTLWNRGLEAGKDIALIGFDDLTLCRFTQPALTTIQFSPRELARLAFEALLEEIQQVKHKRQFEYKTRLVLRDSTCGPRTEKSIPL